MAAGLAITSPVTPTARILEAEARTDTWIVAPAEGVAAGIDAAQAITPGATEAC